MTTNTEMSPRTENDTDDGQRQGRWKRQSALKIDTEHGNDPDDDAEITSSYLSCWRSPFMSLTDLDFGEDYNFCA
jgi:hypothetical protein